MGTPKLSQLSSAQLLNLYAGVMEELRARDLLRSSNGPVADLAEAIVARALRLKLTGKSSAGHDAIDKAGNRYQIKARRLTAENTSRQLSALRRLNCRPFDFLAGVLFDAQFRVMRACLLPHEVVVRRATFMPQVNGHRFLLRDDVWDEPGVTDVTAKAARAACTLGCEAAIVSQAQTGAVPRASKSRATSRPRQRSS